MRVGSMCTNKKMKIMIGEPKSLLYEKKAGWRFPGGRVCC